MKKIKLNKITKELIGCPYVLGGRDPKHGLDCFTFLKYYIEKIGRKFPEKYGVYKLDNYIKYYKGGKWAKPYENLIRSLGKEIPMSYSKSLDILILEAPDNGVSVGINVGNGKALIMSNEGVTTWNINDLIVKRVIRCQYQ